MVEQDKAKRCAELVEKSKEVIRESFQKFDPADTAITWTGGERQHSESVDNSSGVCGEQYHSSQGYDD